jgi:hypothetical protein
MSSPEIITRDDAKARGLKRYYTGDPCPRGHVAERWASDRHCVECVALRDPERVRATSKAWAAANAERKRATDKAWAAANRERLRAASNRWRAANPALVRASVKAWEDANHGWLRVAKKTWRTANPERVRATTRAWIAANPDRVRAHKAKRRLVIDRQTPAWADLEAIVAVYRDCPAGMHVDHWAPIKGRTVSGLHCEANLQYLTDAENMTKGNRFPSDDAWTPAELRAALAAVRRADREAAAEVAVEAEPLAEAA